MYVIYCSEQLDGIAAAAIVSRYARLRNSEYRIGGFLNYTNIEEKFAEMAMLKGALIFILDFSPEQIQNIEEKLKAISAKNRIAYWNSHHPYTAEMLEILRKYVRTVEFSGKLKNSPKPELMVCSTELVGNKFMPMDSVTTGLKKIAHDIEFWIRKDERSLKLTDLISSGFDKKELIDSLSRGVIWSDRYEKLRKEYFDKKQKAFADLLKKLEVKTYLNKKFGFSLAPSILSTADAGDKLLTAHQAIDVSVIIYRNGKISFRRRDGCDIDLSKLAKLFDGGGHAYASGGMIKEFKNISYDNFDKVLFFVDRKLKDWFLK
ncbi:MAG: DHHA1 domain-containing protein [Candidatus Woesearchaeota archaeon]